MSTISNKRKVKTFYTLSWQVIEKLWNDEVTIIAMSRNALLRYTITQSVIHCWEATLLWSFNNLQNVKISFFIPCIGGLEMILALHGDFLFPWRIRTLHDSCLLTFVKIPVFNPPISEARRSTSFFLSFSRDNIFASIHSIPLRQYYVIANFDNAFQLEPS